MARLLSSGPPADGVAGVGSSLWTGRGGCLFVCALPLVKSKNAEEALCAQRGPLFASTSENAAKVCAFEASGETYNTIKGVSEASSSDEPWLPLFFRCEKNFKLQVLFILYSKHHDGPRRGLDRLR